MTTFKKYLGYRLKSALLATVSFSLIALLVTVTTAFENVSVFEYRVIDRTGIESLATIMGIIASIIPMLETNAFKNRRNLDTLYFLPLSRFKMALAHYISGFIQMFMIYTVAFIGHTLVLLPYAKYLKLQYMPLYYVLLLVLGIAIYSIFIFLYGEANSSTDGVICAIMWIFALYLLALVAIEPIREYAFYFIYRDAEGVMSNEYYIFMRELDNFTSWFIPYTPINNLTVVFQDVIEGREMYIESHEKLDELISVHIWPTFGEVIEARYSHWYMVFLPIVAGAASVFGYFRTFTHKGAEKIGEVSSSPFCYKVLIPIYGFVCFAFSQLFGITFFLIIAAMYIAYAIYRKSFKIKKADVFSMLGTVAVSIAFLLAIMLISEL